MQRLVSACGVLLAISSSNSVCSKTRKMASLATQAAGGPTAASSTQRGHEAPHLMSGWRGAQAQSTIGGHRCCHLRCSLSHVCKEVLLPLAALQAHGQAASWIYTAARTCCMCSWGDSDV